ncbi:hypothetical protein CORC01_11120 [Colletotrichum orchidophilum]|uniref:Yippee/Mis18/Cereblon domain-containing protein n=1 Tax=Colletotrichum orchidophilum TaxID=1209926 RepID=A0A1G4AWW7_9PEZI|nr:uncharacterized protein CORC01_11120 [Colletotrichum orchidophilum]OHE93621.1 hypothetical protein CORC01_11120 [Colletotrichum orchidophilum]
MMEVIQCKCTSCQTKLANFFNLWTQIGKSYFSPLIDAQGTTQMVAKEPTRIGEAETLVAGCELQDVSCVKCDNVIGLKCLSSPVNHVLCDSQILLRQTSVVFLKKNGKPIELDVRRKLKLRDDSRTGSCSTNAHFNSDYRQEPGFENGHRSSNSENIDLLRLRADLDTQRENIERIDTAGFQVISQFDGAVSRIEKEIAKLRSTMDQLQKDIDLHRADLKCLKSEGSSGTHPMQNSPKVSRLESQVRTASAAISEMQKLSEDFRKEHDGSRRELQTTREDLRRLESATLGLQLTVTSVTETAKESLEMARDSAKETASLRTELTQLRRIMEQDRKNNLGLSKQQIPSRELDILTSNITKIGTRANQVETLQMEFDLFKSRIQRLEASAERPARSCEESQLAPGQQPESSETFPAILNFNIDAASNGVYQEANARVPTEAITASPKVLQPTSRKRRAPAEQITQAGEEKQGPRLTRSGNIDKRSAKKSRVSLPVSRKG